MDTAYRARMDDNFHGEYKGRKVECDECGKLLAVRLLAEHQAKHHDIYQLFVLEEEEDAPPPPPRRWDAAYYLKEGGYRCPVPGCPQGREGHGVRDSYNLRWHFSYRHSQDRVAAGGVCLQKCRLWGMKFSTAGTPA